MFYKILENVKKPKSNIYGRIQLKSMNERHNSLALWGISHMDFADKSFILDVGCGGGKNVENMLKLSANSQVYGVDYSEASVKMSIKHNMPAVKAERTKILQGTAEELPFENDCFSLVTAFETIYFWNLEKGFNEVLRVLKNGGQFMITNEAQTKEGLETIMEKIGFEVYSAEEIKDTLLNAGFKNIQIDKHKNNKWLNIIATK